MITLDHKGAGGSGEGPNMITRYLNSPLLTTVPKRGIHISSFPSQVLLGLTRWEGLVKYVHQAIYDKKQTK